MASGPDPSADPFSLDGRVAIVTGASRGIGAAIANGLGRAGAQVVGVARSTTPAEAALFPYRRCDVTDHDAFRRLCVAVAAECGRLDILVNAAGITLPAEGAEQSVTAFESTLAVNLPAAYACCIAAAAAMRAGGGGSIVNVTSIGSVLGFPRNPGYVAAKGGLRMLTKALALDLADDGIRVNNLVPGYVHTAMTAASYAEPEAHGGRLRHMILPRWGQPDDLVGAAVFLASDASAYVTGSDLFVDGGWTAKGLT
jgi:NAD(P)-dependent dehydrogenase (short-subunit alcohol dehydrogenase family)